MAGRGSRRSAVLRAAAVMLLAAGILAVLAPEMAEARGSRKIKLHDATEKVKPKHDHITFDPMVQEAGDAQGRRGLGARIRKGASREAPRAGNENYPHFPDALKTVWKAFEESMAWGQDHSKGHQESHVGR